MFLTRPAGDEKGLCIPLHNLDIQGTFVLWTHCELCQSNLNGGIFGWSVSTARSPGINILPRIWLKVKLLNLTFTSTVEQTDAELNQWMISEAVIISSIERF